MKKKPTGERELFFKIWKERPHVCTACNKRLYGEPRVHSFSHILVHKVEGALTHTHTFITFAQSCIFNTLCGEEVQNGYMLVCTRYRDLCTYKSAWICIGICVEICMEIFVWDFYGGICIGFSIEFKLFFQYRFL